MKLCHLARQPDSKYAKMLGSRTSWMQGLHLIRSLFAEVFFCILNKRLSHVLCSQFCEICFHCLCTEKKILNDQIKCFHFASHGTIHVNENKNLSFIVWEKNKNYLKLLLFSLFRCQAEKSCSKSKLFWILSQTAFISLCLMSLSKL